MSIVTHVHGAHIFEESDGYPEAWYFPAVTDIPASYALTGILYAGINVSFQQRYSELSWEPGTAHTTIQMINGQQS